jgi:integrase
VHPPDATNAARRRTRWHAAVIDAKSEKIVDAFIDWRYANNLAPVTIRNDRSQLVGLIGALGGVDELTPGGLRRLAELRGWKQGTHAGYHKLAGRFTRWAVKTGRLDVDPFLDTKAPPRGEVEPNPCTTHERDVLIALAPEPVRSWLTLAAYAGLRCHEIAQVDPAHLVNTDDGLRLLVPRGKGRKAASVAAHPFVVELLAGKPHGRLWDATANAISWRCKYVMNQHGVTGGAHRLRATFATELYRATGDVMVAKEACRHRSIASTMHYVRTDADRVRRAIDEL